MNFSAILTDRGIVRVSGEAARDFLQGLFTCDMKMVAPGQPAFGALLTPQGKILFDFFVYREGNYFLLDCRRDAADELARRLTFYKLRAAVEIENISEQYDVIAGWGNGALMDDAAPDPRVAAMGWRGIVRTGKVSPTGTLEDWHAQRIKLGIPEGDLDYKFGNTFPHEADMDLLNGVSFSKGCYVGQEVVSRMQHRGTSRTRTIPVMFDGPAPSPGTEIRAGEKQVGTFGSHAEGRGIALARIDRIASAKEDNQHLLAGGILVMPVDCPWADFGLSGKG